MNYSLNSSFWQSYAGRNSRSLWQSALWILTGTAVLALASQCSIPWQPVPLTLQSATVIFLAALLGPRLAVQSVGLYLIVGACGLPVFADFSAGPQVFMGPTAGYLLGFLPAAYCAGFLFEKGAAQHWLSAWLASLAATALIFACGVAVLSLFVGLKAAVTLGIMPFIFTEALKLVLVAIFVKRSWRPV